MLTTVSLTLRWVITFLHENAPALTHLPRHAFCSPFAQLTSFGDVRGHSDVRGYHDVTSYTRILYQVNQIRKTWKLRFLTLWPWPLTYDLDYQTWPRFHQGQPSYQFLGRYAKRFSRESAHKLTDGKTERQKDGKTETRDRFYYLDRWRGR